MRPHPAPTLAASVPEPGTAEAIEQGCICHSIAHSSGTDELEPAAMLVPDPNCPLHGAVEQLRE
jgi:hypothetical protein